MIFQLVGEKEDFVNDFQMLTAIYAMGTVECNALAGSSPVLSYSL